MTDNEKTQNLSLPAQAAHTINVAARMMIFRGETVEVPRSTDLMMVMTAVGLILGYLSRIQIPDAVHTAVVMNTAVEYAYLLITAFVLTSLFRVPQAFLQVTTAALAISVIADASFALLRSIDFLMAAKMTYPILLVQFLGMTYLLKSSFKIALPLCFFGAFFYYITLISVLRTFHVGL